MREFVREIFKEFEYLHGFKLQIFRTTLDDGLSLNSDLNGNEFSSIVMIPFFKIKKEKTYGTLLCLWQTHFMSIISFLILKIIIGYVVLAHI